MYSKGPWKQFICILGIVLTLNIYVVNVSVETEKAEKNSYTYYVIELVVSKVYRIVQVAHYFVFRNQNK